MLALTLKPNERLYFRYTDQYGEPQQAELFTVLKRGTIRVYVDAPKEVRILRENLLQEEEKNERDSVYKVR